MKVLRPILRLPITGAVASALLIAVFVGLAQEPLAQPDLDTTNRIFLSQPDGSAMKLLVDLPDYTAQGSPCWSQDGKLIVFDAWRPKLNETNTDSKIILIRA